MNSDNRRGRLHFRSWHRGTREMDLLLGNFADAHLHAFTPDQLDLYEAMLEVNDPEIYDWITGKSAIPSEHDNDVVRLACGFKYSGGKVS